MENYNSGYPLGIAKIFETPVSQVQRQMERFELEGIIVSRLVGKTRLYEWNPRYLFLKELRNLLSEVLKKLPSDFIAKYFRSRTRPRRRGKPLIAEF